jgi:hypothetical protein
MSSDIHIGVADFQGKEDEVKQRLYSASDVAAAVGVHKVTLLRWARTGKSIPKPTLQQMGSITMRLWTESDLKRIKAFAAKNLGKGRTGRPKKATKKTK